MKKAKWVKIGDEWHLMVTKAVVKLQGRYALYEVPPDTKTTFGIHGRDYRETAIRKCETEATGGYDSQGNWVKTEVIGDKPIETL